MPVTPHPTAIRHLDAALVNEALLATSTTGETATSEEPSAEDIIRYSTRIRQMILRCRPGP